MSIGGYRSLHGSGTGRFNIINNQRQATNFKNKGRFICLEIKWSIDIPDISGICLDTGIGDIDNSKIPIYRHFGILLRNTVLKRCFK
jgi:hypothetical protein